jgi:hypothetical protein
MSEEKSKKVLPFDTNLGFTGLPHAICKFYVLHPWFNPSVERLYRYLLSRHNHDIGYAFPSWNAIIRETQLSRGSVKWGLDVLEHLGLINRHDHVNEGTWNNKFYTFNRPIETDAEFQRRFSQEIADIKVKKLTKVKPKAPVENLDEPAQETDGLSEWL